LEFCNIGFKKTRLMPLLDGLKNFFNDMCIHLDTIPEHDGWTDRQTDRNGMLCYQHADMR